MLPVASRTGIWTGRAVGQVDVGDRTLVCESRLVGLFVGAGIQNKFSRPESCRFDDRSRSVIGVGSQRMLRIPQHGSMAMIGDHHDVCLIENAVILISRENLGNERIGYRLEVVDFHPQWIGGEMRVQIDSRKVDNLNFRNAMSLHGREELRH